MDSTQEREGQVPAYAEDDQYHLPKSDGCVGSPLNEVSLKG